MAVRVESGHSVLYPGQRQRMTARPSMALCHVNILRHKTRNFISSLPVIATELLGVIDPSQEYLFYVLACLTDNQRLSLRCYQSQSTVLGAKPHLSPSLTPLSRETANDGPFRQRRITS